MVEFPARFRVLKELNFGGFLKHHAWPEVQSLDGCAEWLGEQLSMKRNSRPQLRALQPRSPVTRAVWEWHRGTLPAQGQISVAVLPGDGGVRPPAIRLPVAPCLIRVSFQNLAESQSAQLVLVFAGSGSHLNGNCNRTTRRQICNSYCFAWSTETKWTLGSLRQLDGGR